jgi:thiol:disulfide interchange protein
MDTDIYALVAKYGYKNLHVRLEELMREEHAYFCLKFQATPVPLNRSVLPLQEKLVQEIPLPKKKERKLRVKKPVQTSEVQSEDVQLSLENVEMKDVIVTVSEKTFRDPKEMKEFQKAAVEAKQKENEAAGLQPSYFLTKENLKQWIEDEGQTYAWVAREKAGCPENQVSATAKMMGIKSRISKKLGRIITGN